MDAKLVTLTVDNEGVAVVRMVDEAGLNAISEEMSSALQGVLSETSAREDVKVVVIAGLPEYFSTGASREILAKLVDKTIAPGDILLPRSVLGIPVPTIAAMQGHAIGGGLALGICADIVLISRESRYGCTFMNMGFTPGMGTTRLLEHVVGSALAHEMLFTGQCFRGVEFEGRSLFNYILPRAEVLPKALDLASRIAEKPRFALTTLKENLSQSRKQIYERALEQETAMHRLTLGQPGIADLIGNRSW
jgi:polyketide biosynthesis enoyl-CoA hydratase PksI